MISDRPTQPPLGRFERIAHAPHSLAFGLVGEQLDLALRVVLPFALHGHDQRQVVAEPIVVMPSKPKRISLAEQFGREGDLLLDLALGVDVEQRMRDQLVGVAFGGQPEAAFAVERDAFEVELLGRRRRRG